MIEAGASVWIIAGMVFGFKFLLTLMICVRWLGHPVCSLRYYLLPCHLPLACLPFLESSFISYPSLRAVLSWSSIPDFVLVVCVFMALLLPHLPRAPAGLHWSFQAGNLWFLRSVILSRPSELQGFSQGSPCPLLACLLAKPGFLCSQISGECYSSTFWLL